MDFDAKKAEFPPAIVATGLRPDIVLWSRMSRVVVLIELTCPAEEGMLKAQLRKETKYTGLLDEINATETWKPWLFTVEIGARGLVGLSTHKTFVRLGFTSSQANALCKKLSLVVVRCSYAIYQAHNNLSWSHGSDLIVVEGAVKNTSQSSLAAELEELDKPAPVDERETERDRERQRESVRSSEQAEDKQQRHSNIRTLHDNGIRSLFHFTDESNLESISKHGLLTWKKLGEQQIAARMNSSELSHRLDAKAGLADFVRLSFCKKHPMMYLALKDRRISRPVVLEIKLEVVSRPGVLFCEINAASSAAKASEDPSVIHFETVKAGSQYNVSASERRFFQGEVLVPGWIPPHLIRIPKADAFTNVLELRGRLPDSSLTGYTLSCEIEVKDSNPFSLAKPLHQNVAAGAGSSTPEPLVSLLDVHSAGFGKGIQETFAASKGLRTSRGFWWLKTAPKVLKSPRAVVGWSNLRKTQEERKQRLANLVDPDFMPLCEQVAYDLKKALDWMKRKPRPLEVEEPAFGCQMPLTMRASCGECRTIGLRAACPLGHMRFCGAPIWFWCRDCDRVLCWDHMPVLEECCWLDKECFCKSQKVGIGGIAERERALERERQRVREQEERQRKSEWN